MAQTTQIKVAVVKYIELWNYRHEKKAEESNCRKSSFKVTKMKTAENSRSNENQPPPKGRRKNQLEHCV